MTISSTNDLAIVVNAACIITEAGQASEINTTNSATGRGDAVGVATAAFADNEYGWLAVYGTGTDIAVLVAASAAASAVGCAARVDSGVYRRSDA